ncbi:Zinc-binding alcohol dehydrogenase domain-containing protein cipB [Neolecta irregularis DAH-3]|uniref:Zinc-binding alcohol dehydrogenase domain-containing protein cipB n=1 Tax=Neolecta irregularis (strain DAH-3) TaxID=1198029 RepID=A0A1U7LN49_NEOID|nr:Zinc-binding alcohol dehydrogenase domain-containing protein cipB [Neolecta irregularis DAH-3]|eukprot:OLL24013.1 Zinc-binding alcohol dehydrogenase domain-containing protein cipB [Neolecta irregularis DAH-3]
MFSQLSCLILQAGYHVITTASKHNHDYLTSLGASKNFDYHDSDVVEQIKKEGKIQVIYDAISENGSIEKCMQVLQPHGGKMVAVLPVNATVPDNVKVYQCFGGSVHKTSVALGKWLFNDFLKEALIQETIVTAPPVKVAKGGLRGVPDALAMQKKGVSATKIIIHPCEDGCT